MIQHDALPADPDHLEKFIVPAELTIGVSAFIRIFQENEYVGEAVSLEKVANISHAWMLSHVIMFRPVDFNVLVTVKTSVSSASTLGYFDTEGWTVTAFRSAPLHETSYTGMLSKNAVTRDYVAADILVFEQLGFKTDKKGETL
jgi:hypothetical protein